MYPQTDEASDVFCSNFWVVQRYRLLKPFLLPDFPPDFRIFFRIPPSVRVCSLTSTITHYLLPMIFATDFLLSAMLP